jgi:hypothetical protein
MRQTLADLPKTASILGSLGAAFVLTGALLAGRWGVLGLVVVLSVTAFVFRGLVLQLARRSLLAVKRHPISTFEFLLVFPLGLIAVEAATLAISHESGWLRFLVMDVCPRDAAKSVLECRDDFRWIDYATMTDREVLRIYNNGLHRGDLLAWTIPASLPSRTSRRPNAPYSQIGYGSWLTYVDPLSYLAFKAMITVGIFSAGCLLLLIAVRWLEVQAHSGVKTPPTLEASHTWEPPVVTRIQASWSGSTYLT